MFEQKKEKAFWLRVSVSTIMFASIVIWPGCKKQPAEQTHSESTQSESAAQTTSESATIDIKPSTDPKVSLKDIIQAARTWEPSFTAWYGKPAPDFALTDLDGKEHKLSDYKGKKVLLVLWATWCPPCRKEIPDLIELRETVSEDKLAMLAISNEKPDLVKSFVAQAKLNYTVLLDQGTLPGPYNTIKAIPSSFFIDPEGKIKLATSGLVSLSEIKAILLVP
jgi:cytochrome c biogenesis protein CcmG/thiol:disulfide interchange protein DsbE